jgi:serine/threonine protein kinase
LDVILHEYILISPLVNTTFRSLYVSNVSAEDRVACFAQLLEAINFLHRHGIWHRDVNPDSVLVRSYDPPDVMLTGFGCASDAMDIPYDGAGTEQYRAPEQVEGKTHGRAVDYWGCGIIGLELILKRPIESRIVPGLGLPYYQKVLEDLQDWPLARCSRKMLEESPGSRMTAIDALLDLRSPKTGGARIDPEGRCHPPECIFTNDVDFEVHSDNGAADLMANVVAIDESSVVDGVTGDSPAQVDSTNSFARSSSIDLVEPRSDNDGHAHVNESVVGMTEDQYTTESNKRRKLIPCEIDQRTSGLNFD